MKKWKQKELVQLFEILLEKKSPLVTHHVFRGLLSRDEALYTNQVVREANGNIAYRSVDFELDDLDDEVFWERIDETPYQDIIEDNAAVAIVKMAEKFNLIR